MSRRITQFKFIFNLWDGGNYDLKNTPCRFYTLQGVNIC